MAARIEISRERSDYEQWAGNAAYMPLFYRPAWWDALEIKGGWEAFTLYYMEEAVGGMPWFLDKSMAVRRIRNPAFTPYSGPWWPNGQWAMGNGQSGPNLYLPVHDTALPKGIENRMWKEILKNLPPHEVLNLRLHPSLGNFQALLESKVEVRYRHTYLWGVKTEPEVYNKLARQVEMWKEGRNSIIRTQDVELAAAVLRQAGGDVPFGSGKLKRWLSLLLKEGMIRMYLARNKTGQECGLLLVATDERTAYSLSCGILKDRAPRATHAALRLHAMEHMKEEEKVYDACGSKMSAIERLNRHLGGKQMAFADIFRASSLWMDLLYRSYARWRE